MPTCSSYLLGQVCIQAPFQGQHTATCMGTITYSPTGCRSTPGQLSWQHRSVKFTQKISSTNSVKSLKLQLHIAMHWETAWVCFSPTCPWERVLGTVWVGMAKLFCPSILQLEILPFPLASFPSLLPNSHSLCIIIEIQGAKYALSGRPNSFIFMRFQSG